MLLFINKFNINYSRSIVILYQLH